MKRIITGVAVLALIVGVVVTNAGGDTESAAAERRPYTGREIAEGVFFGTGIVAREHPSLAPADVMPPELLSVIPAVLSRSERSNPAIFETLGDAVSKGRRPAVLDALGAAASQIQTDLITVLGSLPTPQLRSMAPAAALPIFLAVVAAIVVAVGVAAVTAMAAATVTEVAVSSGGGSGSSKSKTKTKTSCGTSRACRMMNEQSARTFTELLVDDLVRELGPTK